ncbi:MAG: signal peptidase I [Planctomycetes bacterium]|nr:signal peptidase I [Planctomycetota bacterium]
MSSRLPPVPADLRAARPVVMRWTSPAVEAPDAAAARAGRRARSRRSRLRLALLTGLQMGLLLLTAYGLVFNFSVVRGSSMSPGIHDGDRIVIDHLSLVLGDVQRGDIVVLQYPLDPSVDYIKRVIGVPGDRVRVADGRVQVNGRVLDEPYVVAPDPRTSLVLDVQPGTYFVLGDNRRHSSDSRDFGLVPRSNLVGKVDLRVWPPQRAGLLY